VGSAEKEVQPGLIFYGSWNTVMVRRFMAMKKKIRLGRPPKSKAEKQSARISVYMTEAEAKRIKAESAEAEISPSAYLLEIWRLQAGQEK
jgi:hypothetical protein